MFFDLTTSMSINIPVAPESTRASTNMGVLLSTVLRHRGTSVPLLSKVDCTRMGSLEGCSGGCLGILFSSQINGDR